jgi:UDP-GlcNAc:undecaprenyl-phosphate GlcNAc-1-phosphate transferase
MDQLTEWTLLSGFALSAFAACLVGFPVAIRFSKAVGLVDRPSQRKTHIRATPLVGGITIFIAFAIVSAIYARDWLNMSMMAWIAVVLAVGIYDDFAELSAINRLAIHAAIVLGIYYTDGLAVFSIGDVLGNGPVLFTTSVGLLLTVVAVLGAVNAVNMIDGIDGLLGSLAIVSFLTLLIIAINAQAGGFSYKGFNVTDIATILGALCAFLLFNCRFFRLNQAVVFLGDAGSTAIGFCLVFLLIDFSQGANPLISPVTAGWILGLPLLDASAVIGKRVIARQSPFKPGRDHIHHLFIDSGLSVNTTVAILTLVHCLLVLVGVSGKLFFGAHADTILFWSFVSLVFVRILTTRSLLRFAHWLGSRDQS